MSSPAWKKLPWIMLAALFVNAAQAETPVSFRHEVLPILTKAGCNSGTCHGSPSGKNGFRLSLRGYDPAGDLQTLTRDAQGRRIDPLDPDASLVLLKATNRVPHEGGRRLQLGSDFYRLLCEWIGQTATHEQTESVRLVKLEVSPPQRLLDMPAISQALRATASFDDGTQRDVAHLVRFKASDESVATVTSDGLVEKQGRGEVIVTAEYGNQFAAARLVFLEPSPGFVWPNPPEENEIDRQVFAKLKLLSIGPSSLCSDAEFVRRVYLDLIGRLPTVAEAKAFSSDKQNGKRARLVDALLQRPEFADWWASKWADRLGCNRRFAGKLGALKYQLWIRQAMATNVPEDQFVREILTAGGPNYTNPAATFWRRLRVGAIVPSIDPQLAAEEVSQLFLGVRIQCARCHNHPAERWTQDDFYGLAAFFTRVRFQDGAYVNNRYDKEESVIVARTGEVRHPRSGEVVPPTVLDGKPLAVTEGTDLRAVFTEWLTAPDNRFFARTSVNRLWFHLFGRGLVEPVDDFRSSNPPSHPELLDWLADDFVRHGFDRQHTIRLIVNSRTYQASSRTTATNAGDDKYYSHAPIRLLQSEQLMDAICQATEVAERYPDVPLGTPAIALADGEYKHPFLEAFGRPVRASACECERDAQTNLSQALQLVSGAVVQNKVHSDLGRAARLAASNLSTDEVLDELYLATLGRTPNDQERQTLGRRLTESGPARRPAIEDVLWLLLNHPEFLFQH